MLRSRIAADSAQLKADGYQVVRPATFFISDGVPTDDEQEWRGAFEDLTFYNREANQGNPQYPNMIPFGVDAADRDTLLSIVHPSTGPKRMKLYMMADGADAGRALAQMAEVLISSVLRSGDAVSRGGGGVVLPSEDELGEGIEQFDPEEDLI